MLKKDVLREVIDSELFDEAWYVATYKDLADIKVHPLIHYLTLGWKEERIPSLQFDGNQYLCENVDVRQVGMCPLIHYVVHGSKEGRILPDVKDVQADIWSYQRKATPRATNSQWGIKPEGINLIAVENCTNKCEYCATSSQFTKRKSYSAAEFFPWLDMLFGDVDNPFKNKRIILTGGEPFLHPDLFGFIDEMRNRYQNKEVDVATNFFWASDRKIEENSFRLNSLRCLLISKYPNTVEKFGSEDKFDKLILKLRESCPDLIVQVTPMIKSFVKWDFRETKKVTMNACSTAHCYILSWEGKLFRCSLAYGIEKRPEHQKIKSLAPERLFDLSKGMEGFQVWSEKYPIDLCHHCTFLKHEQSPFRMI